MRLLLTELLPLRTTTQLGAFAEEQVLPIRYGDLRKTRFKLIRMTSTKFFAAAHAMEITRAFVGNLETKAFDFKIESLGDFNYTVVEFAAPVPIGTEATASGLGKRNATTGALMENPADIAADILAIAGRDDPWWGALRAQASAASITLAHSLSTADAIRNWLDSVIDSCGAIWCPGMARLYPAAVDGYVLELEGAKGAQNLQVSASLIDTADILRLFFDHDEAEGKNQSFIQLEASPQRYGGVIVDLTMPWLRSAAQAEPIGRRVLGRLAGERYDVSFETAANEFTRPGTWVKLVGHPQWPFATDPMLMITSVTINRLEKRAQVVAEAIVSTPTIMLTKHSLGTDSIGAGGVEVAVRNGVATFTVLDPLGKPLVGAYVALDGAAPKKTDGQGQVAFTVTQTGQHTLDISATGYLPLSLVVTL